MARRLILVLVGAVALFAAVYLGPYGRSSEAPGRPEAGRGPPPAPVLIATVSTRTVPITLDAIGTVQARSTVTIRSQVSGQLIEVAVEEGQTVRRGDVLFRIDPRPFEAQLQQAEADLARDQASLEKAQADLARYQSLSEKGFSSQQKYEEAVALKNALAATIRGREAAIELARLNLEHTTIRAPVDGRTGSLLAFAGNLVEANGDPMLVITQTQPVNIAFSVPEKYLSRIKQRLESGTVPVTVTIPEGGVPPIESRLFFINNSVDTTTGTIQLKSVYENRDEALTPGQFVHVQLELEAIDNAVVVPSQAVQNGQKGQYVFVMKPDRTVEMRTVEIGPAHEDVTVIHAGLKPGEIVISDGQLRLFPGAKVAPRNDGDRKREPASGPAQS